MAYRSIKRVIGETSLERKCRFLFGACLSLLLFVTFWWVEHIAEDLVKGTTIRKGHDLVDISLLRYHWEVWENDEAQRELAEEMYRDLQTQEYEVCILAFDGAAGTVLPEDEAEEELVRNLKIKYQESLRNAAERAATDPLEAIEAPDVPTADTRSESLDASEFGVSPVRGAVPSGVDEIAFEYKEAPREEEIHYYQPVYWKNSCVRCHEGLDGGDAFSPADQHIIFEQESYPFRVVKVKIPDEETQNAITWNRAILWAIGILTVFLAMVILYVIIRYVVIKPLQHLRDVSEEISRGNQQLRAEIHTNDEFEELASAFNRMLRHMTEAQVELQDVNADLDAKVDQLAQLNMRLYEMNRLKSDFLANMSHELRTPLNSIIGFSEVLAAIDTLSDKQKRYAQNICKSGRLLLDMINDILDLAKIEAGKMDVRLSEFQISTVVTAQCEMVRSLTEEKNIDLECQFEPDLPPVYQDQGKLQQILINLLSNAIKFTPEGGRIAVSVHIDERDQLVLAVADTGVGIAEEDREIVFEKFRQSSQAVGEGNLTREYSGTGLGLSIVRELCKLLGGEVQFESELGKGSTFFVKVPSSLTRPEHHQSAIDSQLGELVESQRLATQQSASPWPTTLLPRLEQPVQTGPGGDRPDANVPQDTEMLNSVTKRKRPFLLLLVLTALAPRFHRGALAAGDETSLDFEIRRTVARNGFDGRMCWVHARAGAIPPDSSQNGSGRPLVVMTMQQLLLSGSDVFYALNQMRTGDLGRTWDGPRRLESFARQPLGPDREMTVCDFTLAWHAASGRLLGTGHTVVYEKNRVMHVRPRATAYAVYDAAENKWLPWKTLDMPDEPKFVNAGAGSVQRFDLPQGDILLPIYFKEPEQRQYSTTVCRCTFDGRTLKYVEHGSELTVNVDRGLCEPSLTRFAGRFYLTMRNDQQGYVSASCDGLDYDPPRPWQFDDGSPLGNYNTQQHWVTHDDGLFLVYTRRGADNDHVFRHRAPLFIARVDPDRLQVIRATERIVAPQRGARLGNFGVVDVSAHETWITVCEWMQPQGVEKYGSDNSIFVTRLLWNRPNRRVSAARQ